MVFGMLFLDSNLWLVLWLVNFVFVGVFILFVEVMKNNCVVLWLIVVGELVLVFKVLGSDGCVMIVVNLLVGKFVYVILINDVSGVGGFVCFGDVVDVLVICLILGEGVIVNDKMIDVVLENVLVLGVD